MFDDGFVHDYMERLKEAMSELKSISEIQFCQSIMKSDDGWFIYVLDENGEANWEGF